MNMEHLERLVDSGVSRRAFARNVMQGAAGLGVVLALGTDEAAAQDLTDADILNFALNLEYLEAEFYTVAVTGRRISELGLGVSGRGRPGETVGGSRVAMSERLMTVAHQIALDEQVHVAFLREALGSAAVAKPAIDLNALGVGFNSVNEFFTVARAFEDLGRERVRRRRRARARQGDADGRGPDWPDGSTACRGHPPARQRSGPYARHGR